MFAAAGLLPRRVLPLVPLALLWLAAPARADERITTRIEVFGFAGLHVLTLHSRTEETGERYAVAVDFTTKGMASVFDDLTTRAQVSGRLVPSSAQPDWFRNDTRRNGADRHSRVDYRPDGNVDAATTPPLPGQVAAAAARGTVDTLTAYFRLERQLARTGSCALKERVFDGRHAYDLVFSDAGHQALAPRGGQNFTGDTIACTMVRHNWPDFTDPEKDEGARGGTIWYARLLPGDLMVPVRVEMDTQFGVVDGYLAEIHAGGLDRILME
jgi:hypothetical protein